jgi:Flp pilus assembly protein protease CpaA
LLPLILLGAMILSTIGGYTDLRKRRLPNWLTVPGFAVGVVANSVLGGWGGLKNSLLGAALAFALLLAFFLLRSLAAGDVKFAAALGAYFGPGRMVDILIGSIFIAGVMAFALIIYKGRFLESMRNIGHILVSLVTFRLPGTHVRLENPDALTIPWGVALAITVILYGILWRLGIVK